MSAPESPLPNLTPAISAAEIEERKRGISNQIAEAEAAAANGVAQQYGVTADMFESRTNLLRSALELCERHLDTIEQLEALESSFVELTAQLTDFQGLPDPPPYTLVYIDTLRDEARAKQAEVDSASLNVARLEESLVEADQAYKQAESDLAAKVKAASGSPGQAAEWERRLASARVLLAETHREFLFDEVTRAKAVLELRKQEAQFQDRKAGLAASTPIFTRAHLDEVRAKIEESRKTIDAELDQVRKDLEQAVREISRANTALSQATPETRASREAELSALRSISELYQRSRDALRDGRTALSRLSEIWDLRFQIFNNVTTAPLHELRPKLENLRVTAEKAMDILERRQATDRSRGAQIARELAIQAADSAARRPLERELNALQSLDTTNSRLFSILVSQQHLAARTLSELDAKHSGWRQHVANGVATAKEMWKYEFQVGDETIGVSNIVIGLIVLVGGLTLSRRMTRVLKGALQRRMALDANVSAIVEKLLYYALIVSFGLIALNIMQVPLTVFTFAGGALAIGVGFGAQNLIGNFISGILLFIEQPIKIGDTVEVDGQFGRIQSIGARSSHLKLFSGVDMFIPNSKFLEQNVINWTHTDTILRYTVTVGVAYGSNLRDVSKLFMRAIEEHGRILKDPEPIVVFKDFGESALIFEGYFWIELSDTVDARVVCSDVRFRIDKLFREAGITIAYPQREVHMTTTQPVEVRVLLPEEKTNPKRDPAADVTPNLPEDKPKPDRGY